MLGDSPIEPSTYLHDVARGGAGKFAYRGRVRVLLGLPDANGPELLFAPDLPIGLTLFRSQHVESDAAVLESVDLERAAAAAWRADGPVGGGRIQEAAGEPTPAAVMIPGRTQRSSRSSLPAAVPRLLASELAVGSSATAPQREGMSTSDAESSAWAAASRPTTPPFDVGSPSGAEQRTTTPPRATASPFGTAAKTQITASPRASIPPSEMASPSGAEERTTTPPRVDTPPVAVTSRSATVVGGTADSPSTALSDAPQPTLVPPPNVVAPATSVVHLASLPPERDVMQSWLTPESPLNASTVAAREPAVAHPSPPRSSPSQAPPRVHPSAPTVVAPPPAEDQPRAPLSPETFNIVLSPRKRSRSRSAAAFWERRYLSRVGFGAIR